MKTLPEEAYKIAAKVAAQETRNKEIKLPKWQPKKQQAAKVAAQEARKNKKKSTLPTLSKSPVRGSVAHGARGPSLAKGCRSGPRSPVELAAWRGR